jgi:hypothetical protein
MITTENKRKTKKINGGMWMWQKKENIELSKTGKIIFGDRFDIKMYDKSQIVKNKVNLQKIFGELSMNCDEIEKLYLRDTTIFTEYPEVKRLYIKTLEMIGYVWHEEEIIERKTMDMQTKYVPTYTYIPIYELTGDELTGDELTDSNVLVSNKEELEIDALYFIYHFTRPGETPLSRPSSFYYNPGEILKAYTDLNENLIRSKNTDDTFEFLYYDPTQSFSKEDEIDRSLTNTKRIIADHNKAIEKLKREKIETPTYPGSGAATFASIIGSMSM